MFSSQDKLLIIKYYKLKFNRIYYPNDENFLDFELNSYLVIFPFDIVLL